MPDAFTCPRCGATSHNPNDVRERYCGRCHDWTGDTPPESYCSSSALQLPQTPTT